MIVVLDTNVLISALLSADGSPAHIIQQWEVGLFDVATSGPLLEELKRALGYERVSKFLGMAPREIITFIDGWSAAAICVDSVMELDVVGDDPDDNRVLERAIASGANYIVSTDDHLLGLEAYQGIEVLSPAGSIVLLNM
jgi:putative PIN family toxin of toxin-antitoxin system